MIKQGVTGFGYSNLNGLYDKLEELKTTILSLNRFKIISVCDQQPSNNYIRIKLLDYIVNKKNDILINCQYGYSCCVTNESSWMELEFIEAPSVLKTKLKNTFHYLKPGYLNLKIDDMDIRNLSKEERKQVSYWKSETKGEIIFNGYD